MGVNLAAYSIFFCWAWHAFIHIHGNGVNDRHSRECNDDLDYGAGLKKSRPQVARIFLAG